MHWFRKNRIWVSRLALFALALQFVLSFGHVHVGKASASPRLVAAVADLVGAPSKEPGRPPAPGQSRGADDYCAICASTHLLDGSMVAAAPQLPAPPAAGGAHSDYRPIISIAARRAPFQSRAPPVV
jgi:hypothetical protein